MVICIHYLRFIGDEHFVYLTYAHIWARAAFNKGIIGVCITTLAVWLQVVRPGGGKADANGLTC